MIRHARPVRVENRAGRPADPPLGELGQRQAARLARWLADEPIHALYASPMRRAVETARPLAERTGLELRLEPGLVELDHLSERYVPLEELKAENYEAWLALMRGGLYAGIDLGAFRRGVAESLERIVAAHPGRKVAVVCHGGVINAWAAHVLGLALESSLFFDPTYASISRFLAAGSGERSVESLNETAHLRESQQTRR